MTGKLLVSAAIALTAVLAPSAARADEPVRPAPHDVGVYPQESTRLPLLLVGFGATAVWYGGAAGFSYLWPGAPGANDLRIPVAGPWMALKDTGCADNDPGCSTLIVVLRAILTTMDGVGQAGGIAVMGEALFLPTYADGAAPAPRARLRRSSALEIQPVPIVGDHGSVGLGVVGRF